MTISVLDPTHEATAPGAKPAPRPTSLEGATIGIISNGKSGAKGYFAHLERMLRDEMKVGKVELRVKSNFSAPADRHIVDEISRWRAVVTGVGD